MRVQRLDVNQWDAIKGNFNAGICDAFRKIGDVMGKTIAMMLLMKMAALHLTYPANLIYMSIRIFNAAMVIASKIPGCATALTAAATTPTNNIAMRPNAARINSHVMMASVFQEPIVVMDARIVLLESTNSTVTKGARTNMSNAISGQARNSAGRERQ